MPRPYQIDDPTMAVQTAESVGDNKVIFRHVLARLDRSNFQLLLDREKQTKRVTERLGKGRVRHRNPHEVEADAILYRALMEAGAVGGGWRPSGLKPVHDLELVEENHREYYVQDDEGEEGERLWRPTQWNELPLSRMMNLAAEKQSAAITRLLMCKAEFAPDANDISFMFEEAGSMPMRLSLGDPDEPAYVIYPEMRRPESQRRSNFRDSFAYSVDTIKGDAGKSEMIIDLRQGVGFFDEHFSTILEREGASPIMFRPPSRVVDEPVQVSAVPIEGEDEFIERVPYSSTLRGQLLKFINPLYAVEVASAVVLEFNSKDRE